LKAITITELGLPDIIPDVIPKEKRPSGPPGEPDFD